MAAEYSALLSPQDIIHLAGHTKSFDPSIEHGFAPATTCLDSLGTIYDDNRDKDLETLREEMIELNKHNTEALNHIFQIIGIVKKFQDLYSAKPLSRYISNSKPISTWQGDDITSWAKNTQGREELFKDKEFILELMCVLSRASEISEGFTPRSTQMVSLLLWLYSQDHGRILEVATGEGKSHIIAMFAASKALAGEKVDVITSSPVLAERDAIEKKSFYSLLNLTDNYNTNKSRSYWPKQCYRADIVYGSAHDFRGDYICHNYYGVNVFGDRKQPIAIVDEADNQLIEGIACITILDDANLKKTNAALHDMWNLVQDAQEEKKAKKILLQNKDKILNQLHKTLEYLPRKFLDQFLEKMFLDIVNSVLIAKFSFQEGKEYVVQHRQIHYVDFSNTGVINKELKWSDGLHQFLEIKHGLNITEQTLCAYFLSSIAHFSSYGKNLYGITGTIGKLKEQEILHELYKVDTAIIPLHKLKKFFEIQGVIHQNTSDWLNCIQEKVNHYTQKGRALLIIAQTIAHADALASLINKYGINVVRYTGFDSEMQAVKKTLNPGDVVIATNLGGRGTDFKLDPTLIQNGGLHVILTFLPENSRIEKQGFGRAARAGTPGSGELIINQEHINQELIEFAKFQNIDFLKLKRDKLYDTCIEEWSFKQNHKMKLREELLNKFRSLKIELQNIGYGERKLRIIDFLWANWISLKENTLFENYTRFRMEEFQKHLDDTATKAFDDFNHLSKSILDSQDLDTKLQEQDHVLNILLTATNVGLLGINGLYAWYCPSIYLILRIFSNVVFKHEIDSTDQSNQSQIFFNKALNYLSFLSIASLCLIPIQKK